MNPLSNWITPDWPAPANIRACVTTRAGGVSLPPFDNLNLGDHVEDNLAAVTENRQRLRAQLGCAPAWLRQVHSADAVRADCGQVLTADANWTDQPGRACVVLTADCLPVLFCDHAGSRVAAAHAGWRGLAGGVLESTLDALRLPPGEILVWLGPAIGPQSFEVGAQVREAFLVAHPQAEQAFKASANVSKYMADIYALARIRLAARGVTAVYGGGLDTFTDSRFFSYRRAPRTGRFASLVWLK